MGEEVRNILQKLVNAVETAMDPSVSQEIRMQAYQLCEDFKDSSPLCAECGILLADKKQPHIIRHFGLQLIEHCVKFRWNSFSADQKIYIKEHALRLLSEGMLGILEEQSHVKDALSRIVVEMVKREWPQHWPDFINEMDHLSNIGIAQTELVLLIWLRLVEDTVAFQSIQTQRRREIHQAMVANMQHLFAYFRRILQDCVSKYQELKTTSRDQESMCHCKLAQSTLCTLSGFVDWVPMVHITECDNILLQMLCELLSDNNLQFYAAECLLLIVSRKGKVEDRKPLMILFSEGAMSTIWNAAISAANSTLDEYHYVFMKKLVQVLTGLGSQLCTLWGSMPDVTQPSNFDKYLDAICTLSSHRSQMLGKFTQPLLSSFLRHEFIAKDPILIARIPAILENVLTSVFKVGFPSQDNHPSCAYSRLDFDSDDDFNLFFSQFRSELSETIRCCTVLEPDIAFNMAADRLGKRLKKPIELGQGNDTGHCNLSSPAFLEWDAITVFLESTMSRLFTATKPIPSMEKGIQLLKDALEYNTQDPLILSCVLSCISAMFPFLNHSPDILSAVLQKIFAAVIFNLPGQTKSKRSRAVKNVRRHACSVLVKICKLYPSLLLPAFDQLCHHIRSISSDPEQLSSMEKCTLTESLVLISTEFHEFNRQSLFIGDVLEPVKRMWLSDEFSRVLRSTEAFMTYVGLDQHAVEPSSADSCGINRSQIINCIEMVMAIMRRSKWPDDAQAAASGGFVLNAVDTSTVIYRNPATEHIQLLLGNLFQYAKIFNSLWLPENLQRRHQDFIRGYELPDVDRLSILGIPPPYVDNTDSLVTGSKTPLERMQHFVCKSFENLCHILGDAGHCLGYQYYTIPGLPETLINEVFSNISLIPDYFLRHVIRIFIKLFVQYCPRECYVLVLLPVLSYLCPFMQQKLNVKWEIINKRADEGVNLEEQENPESQEIFEDQVVRKLTREYVDLLYVMCLHKKTDIGQPEDVTMDEENTVPSAGHGKDDTLNEFGQLGLKHEVLCPSLIITVFNALSWSDNTTSNRAIGLCWPLINQLIIDGNMTSGRACYLLTAILMGLQQHGQHDGSAAMLVTLGLQAYEALRPMSPEVMTVIQQIPNYNNDTLEVFDNIILNPVPNKPHPDRKKKEIFKKLVGPIIGKNIGQQFKRDVSIKNLPPVFRQRPKNLSVDETENSDIGLCELFKPDKNNDISSS